jgi:hypothetical protein
MPKKITVRLIRLRDNGNATYGVWTVYEGKTEKVSVMTLEPTDLFNLKYVSCIPSGEYHVKKRNSTKYGQHFHIQDVPRRTYILVHCGNLYKETEGCIIVGEYFGFVNNDEILDVKGSRSAMDKLLSALPDEFLLKIVEHPQMQKFYRG